MGETSDSHHHKDNQETSSIVFHGLIQLLNKYLLGTLYAANIFFGATRRTTASQPELGCLSHINNLYSFLILNKYIFITSIRWDVSLLRETRISLKGTWEPDRFHGGSIYTAGVFTRWKGANTQSGFVFAFVSPRVPVLKHLSAHYRSFPTEGIRIH